MSQLLALVAYCALTFTLLLPLRDMQGLEHDWYLTFVVVVVPWLAMVFVWTTCQPGRLRLWATIVLIWLPEFLEIGLSAYAKPLGLTPGIGVFFATCFFWLIGPFVGVMATRAVLRPSRRSGRHG